MNSCTDCALIKIRRNLWLKIILIALASVATVKGKPKTAPAEEIAQIASQVKDIIFNAVAAKKDQGFELSFAKYRLKRQASVGGAMKQSGYSSSSSHEHGDRRRKRSLNKTFPVYNEIMGVQSLPQMESLMPIHPHYHRFKRVACWVGYGYGYGDGTGDDELERRRRQQAARKRKAAQKSKIRATKKTTQTSEIISVAVTDKTPITVKRQTEMDDFDSKMDEAENNEFKFSKLQFTMSEVG